MDRTANLSSYRDPKVIELHSDKLRSKSRKLIDESGALTRSSHSLREYVARTLADARMLLSKLKSRVDHQHVERDYGQTSRCNSSRLGNVRQSSATALRS